MGEISIRRVDTNIAEVNIQPANSESHIVRVHRTNQGDVGVSWPMLQGADSRTARLYAEALMAASRIAEEFSLPCPDCGGALEIHREQLTAAREVVCGHVYRCTECGNIMG